MPKTNDILPPSNTDTTPTIAKRLSLTTVIISLSLLLGLMALSIAGIALYQLQQHATQTNDTQATTLAQLSEINQDLAQQQQHLKQLSNTAQALTAQQQQTLQQLNHYHQIMNTVSLQKSQSDDGMWQLKKAYNLMQLAQLNLHWNRDLVSSIALLKYADQLIKQLDLADTLTIRQTLATEITQLSNITPPDRLGLMSKLSAIAQQIPLLPLENETLNFTPAIDTSSMTSTSGWRHMLQQSWQALQKIIIIRQRSQPAQPLLSVQQRRLLDDRVILLLQQAQWAVLQPDAAVYQFSLEQAITAIKRNFASDVAQTTAMLQQLATLKQQNIAPALPDITASQLQLQQYMKQYREHLLEQRSARGA